MTMSKKAQHDQDNVAAEDDATASREELPSESKGKIFKLPGWRNFGLFKPRFKLGLRRKNTAYEKGYN